MAHFRTLFPNAKLLLEFPILYSGWEIDNIGWVIEDQKIVKLILTSHGGPYVATPKDLKEKIEEYKAALAKTEKALNMLVKK